MNLEFRAFEIPIRIRIWFLPMAFLLGVVNPGVGASPLRMAIWMLVLGSGVLAHELGHALAGKSYGFKPRIELGFVGITYFERRAEVSRGRRMLLIALGPMVGVAIGLLAMAFLAYAPMPTTSLTYFTLDSMMLVNLWWGAANFLPILPLDGGHLLAESIGAFRPNKGRKFAAIFSIGICVVTGVAAAAYGSIEIALLAVLLGFRNHRILEVERKGYDPSLGVKPRDLAYVALTRNDASSVVEFSLRARNESTTPEDSDEASYLLAWGQFLAGKPTDARDALTSMNGTRERDFALEGAIAHDLGELEESLALFEKALPRATPFIEPRMVHAIVTTQRFEEAAQLFDDSIGEKFSVRGIATIQRAAYDSGHDRESIGIGETLFRKTRDASVAFLLACASSRLGQLEAGLSWLRRARERGFDRREVLDADPALEPLRALPEWGELRESFEA